MMRRPLRLKILLILLPILLLAPVYLTGRALFWGTPLLQFVPWRFWAWETIQQGDLPLWNPLLGMGAPLVANYQSALFYPPNWLYFLFAAFGGIAALAWAQALIVVLHLIWAGIGMAKFAEWIGLDGLGQTISGLAFALSGYLVTRAGFLSINATTAWLPWVMLGVGRLYEDSRSPWGRRHRAIAFLAIVMGMLLLAGHAQTAWYSLLLAASWGFFLAATRFPGWRKAQKNPVVAHSQQKNLAFHRFSVQLLKDLAGWSALFGLALLIALGLAAVQLIPTAEYLLQSQRAGAVDFELAMTYSFWPWRFLSFFAPSMFGDPIVGDYWGYANFWEDAVYIGLIPFISALGVVAGYFRRRKFESSIPGISLRGSIGFFLFVIIAVFILAMGSNTPIFPWLYRHVPTFDMFQAPTRITILAEFSLALFAGIGITRLRRPTGRALYWTRLSAVGAFAVMLGAGLAWILMGSISPSFIRATALAGMFGLIFSLLALNAPDGGGSTWRAKPGNSRFWSWALALVVGVDLLLAGWGMNPGVETAVYRESPDSVDQIRNLVAGGRLFLPAEDEQILKFDRFFLFESFDLEYQDDSWFAVRSAYLPNVSLLDRIPSVNNFDPLVPGRFDHWMEDLEQTQGAQRERMLNLMAVEVVEEVDPLDPRAVEFKSRDALPRLRWVPCGLPVGSGEEALAIVKLGSFVPEESVVLEGVGGEAVENCTKEGEARITLLSEGSNYLELKLDAPAPGYLVQADVWYPGWQATIDGKPLDILRANYLFRAVPAPAGEHTYVLVYRPLSFYSGAALSLVVICGLMFGGYMTRKSLQTA